MSKWIKAISCGLVGCMLFSFCQFSGRCANIREQVVRLHVLANSDSKEDQNLKLQVRDAVLTASEGLLDGCTTREDALQRVEAQLPALKQAAQQEIAAQGYDYAAKVYLCRMYFTTREYDAGTLPAGQYDALRVEIGEAKGKNWWCVMFPSICLPATDSDWDTVLSPEEKDIVENGDSYKIGFKVVEWWESFCNWCNSIW